MNKLLKDIIVAVCGLGFLGAILLTIYFALQTNSSQSSQPHVLSWNCTQLREVINATFQNYTVDPYPLGQISSGSLLNFYTQLYIKRGCNP